MRYIDLEKKKHSKFHSINYRRRLTAGALGTTGISIRETVGRFVYNFGALLKTTGVGSVEYDFSGKICCPGIANDDDVNDCIKLGIIGGGGTEIIGS